MKKALLYITSLVLLMMSNLSYAQPYGSFYYGGAIGSGDVDVPGYDDAVVFRFQLGQKNAPTGWEFGVSFGSYDVTGSAGSASTDVTEMDLSFMGYLPIAPTIDVFGRIGGMYWSADAVLYDTYIVGSDDGLDLFYGAGFDFAMTDRLDLRIEIQALPDVSGADITQTLVGLNYRLY
ncbi:MAG: outer membrane beta-barrel protein [Gammaproteobacteria bacterium]